MTPSTTYIGWLLLPKVDAPRIWILAEPKIPPSELDISTPATFPCNDATGLTVLVYNSSLFNSVTA